ncbi:MAG: Hsp20/alpha crystallin family protein [Chloroflexi bacterium]|nr:Hsp20/alpha crystallin family protein [Chloroflexota bacterium]
MRGNVLTISAETRTEHEDQDKGPIGICARCAMANARSVRPPETVKMDQAEASLEDGVLTVTAEDEGKPGAKDLRQGAQRLERGNRRTAVRSVRETSSVVSVVASCFTEW